MPDDPRVYSNEEHALFIEERKGLIDAARESSRTFDQAVLAFGSAAFAASIAFLKDVAPHPQAYSLKWLTAAWMLFTVGLFAVMLSFLFSHKACMFEIESGTNALGKPEWKRPYNRWSALTDSSNYFCIVALFLGLVFWSVFALENVGKEPDPLSKPTASSDKLEKGYTPPPPPPKTPPPATPPSNPQSPSKK